MKKYLIILLLFCIGCSNKKTLTCTYIDKSSIYGTKTITDNLKFKNDKLTSFKRNINFNIEEPFTKYKKNIYNSMKQEAKTFKKYIGGKYKIVKNNNQINLIINIKKIKKNNFSYMKIVIDNYNDSKESYNSIKFECE